MLTTKAIKTTRLLRKLQNHLPRSALITIYEAFVRPDLHYGDIMYDEADKIPLYKIKHNLFNNSFFPLKVQSCKLCNNKYMIASTQITNIDIFAFLAVLAFKLLSCKVLFIIRKDNRNC